MIGGQSLQSLKELTGDEKGSVTKHGVDKKVHEGKITHRRDILK